MVKIPEFKTEEEIQKFWATHDSADYFDDMVDEKVEVDFISDKEVLVLPVEKEYLQDAREIALKKGLSSNALFKEWIISGLKRELKFG